MRISGQADSKSGLKSKKMYEVFISNVYKK